MSAAGRAGRALILAFIASVCGVCGVSCGGGGESDAAPAPSDPDGGPAVPEPAPEGPTHAASSDGNVITYAGTSLGLAGFSANGRVQPHGKPTNVYFEYGPTSAYGSKTPVKPLAPKLAAYYRESWDGGLSGWRGGDGAGLSYQASGGVSGGFARYAEPSGDDYNHADGVGIIHLSQYLYVGFFDADAPTAALGGSEPDFRDAKIKVSVRGLTWRPNGTELVWWSQVDVTHGKPPPDKDPAYSNWAHTGFSLTDALVTGNWETREYRLYNDTTDWTYAGTNRELDGQGGRGYYVYAPLDDVLSRLDTDVFHVLTFVNLTKYPTGSIDYDNLEIAYRNHSLVFPPNGGKVASAPPGSEDPAALTDGYRNGPGKAWKTAAGPQGPQEIVYEFAEPVTIDRVQLHQNPEWPSKDVEVLVSADGSGWDTLFRGTLPPVGALGPNFAYLLERDLAAKAKRLKVRILGGYQTGYWGLGEIEVFGAGPPKPTDDDWYRVNADIGGLARGQTIHYRLVAVQGDKVEEGGDMVFTVPGEARPEVTTGRASRIVSGSAKLEGRLNTLGEEAQVYFEYGPDTRYGSTTPTRRAGKEITPRTFVATLEKLAPGAPVHYRLVAVGALGTSYGRDASFTAR